MKARLLLLVILITLSAACRREAPPAGEQASDRLIMGITADGIYRVTLAELQEAGLVLAELNVDDLHLSQAGTAVPYLLAEDALTFYGRAPDSRYTNIRPYLLQTGQAGLLMDETAVDHSSTHTDTISQTLYLEENSHYEAQALDATHTDPWFWHKIGRGQVVEIPLEIPAVTDGAGQLHLQLWGQTHSPDIENDHDLDLLVNGQPIETIRWDGPTYHETAVALPPGTLQPGSNTITLSNEAKGAALIDIMLLNWLSLDYPAPATAQNDQLSFNVTQEMTAELSQFSGEPVVFDVQEPDHPTQLTGSFADGVMALAVAEGMRVTAVGPTAFQSPQSLTPARLSDWRNPDSQADLLIVTTDALAPALAPLVAAREAQGLTVAVVPVAEIYDEFGNGEATPESINRFVAHALAEWQDPQPRYLFLVGEATTDYRGYASNDSNPPPANLVPSPLVPVGYSGETVSDSRLADVAGEGKPALAVGRWPVDTPQEVESLVERTLAYEAGTAVPNALFATDASEGQFAAMAQRLWEGSEMAETATEAVASAVTHLNGPTTEEVTAAWNEGAWLTTYIGHGSLELWGKDNLFNLEAVNDLQAGQPPIVVQLTCLTGLFAQPGVESLAEVMLQHENGPVLTVAATSLTLSSSQEPFAAALLQNLVNPEFERMGDAFQAAKTTLDVENDALREISDTFVLLGDPSALIVRP
jgi:hypothetical protein